MKNENFGKKASDKISGVTGIITGFCQYITGCDQYLIQPESEDKTKKPDACWFDVNRIDIGENVVTVIDTSVDSGPDMEAPIK